MEALGYLRGALGYLLGALVAAGCSRTPGAPSPRNSIPARSNASWSVVRVAVRNLRSGALRASKVLIVCAATPEALWRSWTVQRRSARAARHCSGVTPRESTAGRAGAPTDDAMTICAS